MVFFGRCVERKASQNDQSFLGLSIGARPCKVAAAAYTVDSVDSRAASLKTHDIAYLLFISILHGLDSANEQNLQHKLRYLTVVHYSRKLYRPNCTHERTPWNKDDRFHCHRNYLPKTAYTKFVEAAVERCHGAETARRVLYSSVSFVRHLLYIGGYIAT